MLGLLSKRVPWRQTVNAGVGQVPSGCLTCRVQYSGTGMESTAARSVGSC
jgi:hypothetical protein